MTQESLDSLKVRRIGRRVVITIPCDIDISNAGALGQALAWQLNAGATMLIVDATRAGHCSGSGVIALVRASRRAEAAGAELRVAAKPIVRQEMTMTVSDHILDTYPSLRAALAGPGPGESQLAGPGPGEGQLAGPHPDERQDENAVRTADRPGVAE
jgi:anti-anti-sigma regulatory factor